jgi:hypothetical protein
MNSFEELFMVFGSLLTVSILFVNLDWMVSVIPFARKAKAAHSVLPTWRPEADRLADERPTQ